jgi:hypothetical protein
MPRIATLSSPLALSLTLALALVAGCAPKPAGKAPDTAPPPTAKDAARLETGKLVTDLMSPSFNGEQQGRILNMGYFMAASALCPDLEVDAHKMGRAVDAVLAMDPPGETPAQKQHQHDAVIMFLGMSTGAMIGSHAEDKALFCQDALKVKGGPPETHLFTSAAPSAPSTAPVPDASTAPQ